MTFTDRWQAFLMDLHAAWSSLKHLRHGRHHARCPACMAYRHAEEYATRLRKLDDLQRRVVLQPRVVFAVSPYRGHVPSSKEWVN